MNILRPYPGRNLEERKAIFKLGMSHSGELFGILAARCACTVCCLSGFFFHYGLTRWCLFR